MFGLNWIKLAIYGGSALLVIGIGWTIQDWHRDAQKLPEVEAALKAEQTCQPDSSCEKLRADDARKAAQLIIAAQAQAKKTNDDAREAGKQADEAKAKEDAATVKQHQVELSGVLSKHSLTCDEWMKEPIKCDMQ